MHLKLQLCGIMLLLLKDIHPRTSVDPDRPRAIWIWVHDGERVHDGTAMYESNDHRMAGRAAMHPLSCSW